jgi:uncharacterized repeat protein (TIGR03803 family)
MSLLLSFGTLGKGIGLMHRKQMGTVVRWVMMMFVLVSSAWAAPEFKVLHAFGTPPDGAGAWSSVTLDKKGNVYGATSGGGKYSCGTVFALIPGSHGRWAEKQLYSFTCGADGAGPFGGATFDAEGNLFGTTMYGGAYEFGNVFELTPKAGGGWTETNIYSLGTDHKDGGFPYAGVTIDGKGNLYGTTPDGGGVFEVTPKAGGSWTETVIHDFWRRKGDGGGPYAGVILDRTGNLYGTTEGGGAHQAGTIYELRPVSGDRWKERILYSFCPAGPPCKDGAVPGLGVLAMDRSGNLYGTAGGGTCCGTIFALIRSTDGHWKESVLYDFEDGSTGFGPGAGVARDDAGNLYGTTVYGGSAQCGCGVVYKLAPKKNGKWEYTVLHAFIGSDGAQPDANLVLDQKGNIYGTAATGGPDGAGVVFEITP